MILPDHIFAVIRALHAQNLTLALGDDDARRLLQQKIVETAVARFSGEGWGWKKASEGRPPSKDSIANNKLAPGHVLAWDCFNGSTREPARGEAITIDDQIFISITGIDHLAGQRVEVEPVPAPPAPAPPPAPRLALPDRGEFLAALTWLDTLYRTQLQRAGGVDLEGIAAHVFDTYLQTRMRGASIDDAKAEIVRRINEILRRTDIHV